MITAWSKNLAAAQVAMVAAGGYNQQLMYGGYHVSNHNPVLPCGTFLRQACQPVRDKTAFHSRGCMHEPRAHRTVPPAVPRSLPTSFTLQSHCTDTVCTLNCCLPAMPGTERDLDPMATPLINVMIPFFFSFLLSLVRSFAKQ